MKRSGKLRRILVSPRLARALLRHGVAASVEHIAALRDLQCRTVVDIGANRGQFALVVRHCFPDATIISFEPLHRPAEVFCRVFKVDIKVELHQVAIGPETGTAIIHVSGRDDSSSLLPITALQNQIFPGTQESGTETIKVGRLEEFVSAEETEPPASLKLDVQGYELEGLHRDVAPSLEPLRVPRLMTPGAVVDIDANAGACYHRSVSQRVDRG